MTDDEARIAALGHACADPDCDFAKKYLATHREGRERTCPYCARTDAGCRNDVGRSGCAPWTGRKQA